MNGTPWVHEAAHDPHDGRAALGTALAVFISCGLGTYLYSRRHFQTLLETARATALSQSELIKVALEHQMMENDRSLIDKMIRSSEASPESPPSSSWIDRARALRERSLGEGNDLTLGSPTCQACHRFPPNSEPRAGSSRRAEDRSPNRRSDP